jgi:hypothetical protein
MGPVGKLARVVERDLEEVKMGLRQRHFPFPPTRFREAGLREEDLQTKLPQVIRPRPINGSTESQSR